MRPMQAMRAVFFVVVMAFARPTLATEPSEAETAFQLGRVLLKEKRYKEACPKFAQSQTLDPAPGTLLALAYCQELAGQLASARNSYLLAAELSRSAGQKDRQDVAHERAAALEERISSIMIVVADTVAAQPGLQVFRDGVLVPPTQWGRPMPADGGRYVIEAQATGAQSWQQFLNVAAEKDGAVVVVPSLKAVGADDRMQHEPSAPRATLSRVSTVREPGASPATSRGPALRDAAWAAGIGAATGCVIGAVFGIIAASRNRASNSDGHCDASGCDARGVGLRNQALNAARVATTSFAVAGGLALGSVTLHILSRDADRPAAPAVAGTLISVEGKF